MFRYICKRCNKRFLLKFSQNSFDGKKRKFCSYECRNESYKGKKISKEHKKKISKFFKGKHLSEKHKRKLSKLHKGKNNPRFIHGLSKTKEYGNYYKGLNKKERKKAKGFYSLKEWLGLLKKYKYMCLCCKQKEPKIKLTIDHIIPLSRGGNNTIKNIQPLCKSCNSRKHDKIIKYT